MHLTAARLQGKSFEVSNLPGSVPLVTEADGIGRWVDTVRAS